MSSTAVESGIVVYDNVDYRIGQSMSAADLDAMPIGATVWDSGRRDHWYTKMTEDGRDRAWQRDDYDRPTGIMPGINTLRSIPGWAASTPVETFAQFKRRFADTVLSAAEEFSEVHQRVARQVLADLDASGSSSSTLGWDSTPPVGTIVTHGNPDQREFTVFRFGRRGWVKLTGHYDDIKDARVVTRTDDGGEVEGDQSELIAAFKQAVWAAGQEVKQQHKWCSRYDEILAHFGIVDPVASPNFENWPVRIKGVEGREELPDGAMLGVSRGDWGIFVKENGEWERVVGTRPLAAGTMNLLFSGEGEFRVENAWPLMDYLPVGSEVLMPTADIHPEQAFVKQEDGMWQREGEDSFRVQAFHEPVAWVG